MDFNHFLSAYYPDKSYGGDRLYADMVEQAKLADRLGFRGVTIPEHHLINILLVPDPLQLAVKVAAVTSQVEIVTSVCVLPLHDMRTFAGASIQADILCEGRLILGVGRGAFAYEMARMGVPIETSREKFDESLDLLMALYAREEVGWNGKYYKFDPVTVMPRPVGKERPPIMMAALVPEAIYASVKRGFHIQTTPLNATVETMKGQVGAFHRGKAELGEAGKHLRLALSRVCICAKDERQAQRLLEHAAAYYRRFDNVFTGPGIVDDGMIRDIPGTRTMEQLKDNLLICPPAEMVDRLGLYADLGVDDFITSSNVGVPQPETLETIERFASEVMPHFRDRKAALSVAAE
jgi:alkanesulfonate monooxygenase SsuD/methylene tetrahydromethanopterin reductase-like flavin-dependent oxidoreductase (luciferase family)